jgi:hypothetical protein
MNKHLIAFAALGFLMASGCKPDQPSEPALEALTNSKEDLNIAFNNSGDLFLQVLGDKNNLGADKTLRGVNIYDRVDTVLAKEKGLAGANEKGMKAFIQDLNSSDYVSSYYFINDQNFVTDIHIMVNLISDSTAKDLFIKLSNFFDQKYGKSFHGLDKYETWNALTVDSFPFALGMKFIKGVYPGSDSVKMAYSQVLINLEETDY